MFFPLRIALLLTLAALPLKGAEPSPDESKIDPDRVAAVKADPSKLVGPWQLKLDEVTASYDFRPDGTFSASLAQPGKTRKFEGAWTLKDGGIIYTFTSDSDGIMTPGTSERDLLLRIDENSYTIQEADGNRRTYWRVK